MDDEADRALLAAMEECRAEFNILQSRINADPGIPVRHPTTSFWQQNPPHQDLVNCKSHEFPQSTDIVIIGSGITGASIAYTIITKCKAIRLHKEVVILKARQACSGATSRNGGHIKVPAYEFYCRNKKRYGKERAKAIVMFQLRHLPILAELEQKMNLEGAEVQEVETVDLFMDDIQFEKSKGVVEELRNDFPELAQDIQVWEGDALSMKFEVGPHVNGAISYASGVISAYRFVSSLLTSLLSTYQDLSLETGTPVQSISVIDSYEKPFLVLTPRGNISASHIIHATNSHASRLIPGLSGKLFSIGGQMSAHRPGKDFPQLVKSRSWSFVQRKGFDYVVQRYSKGGEGGELMTGGGLFQSSEGMDELGLSSDDNTDPVIGAYLNGILPTVFGSENWGEDAPGGRLRDMWTGTMGYTADMQPLVGKFDKSLTGRSIKGHIASSIEQFGSSPAEWVSAGYNGDGMVYAWLCGVAVGLMVLGRENMDKNNELGIPEGKVEYWLPKNFDARQRGSLRLICIYYFP